MAVKFRRTINLFPGVRLNLSKGAISISFGKRGASIMMGPSGLHMNLGVPGTGFSYRTKLGVTESSRANAEARERSKKAAGRIEGTPQNADSADPKLPGRKIEYGLTVKHRLKVIDKETGKSLLGSARKQHVETHKDQVHAYLFNQAEKRNARIRAFGSPHLSPGARDPQATLLSEMTKVPEPPSEKLPSSRALDDGTFWELLRLDPTQARHGSRAALRKEIVAAMPTEKQLNDWHAYSNTLTALRGQKYALRKDLLQCSEAAFTDYVRAALKGIRWPIGVRIIPVAAAVGQRTLITYDVTLPGIEAIPSDEFEIDMEELSLVSKALDAEKRKELWRDYALTVLGTLLAVSFNLTTRIVKVDVSGCTTEASRVGQSNDVVLKASVDRSQFEWEKKGLFAEKQLSRIDAQDWCLLS